MKLYDVAFWEIFQNIRLKKILMKFLRAYIHIEYVNANSDGNLDRVTGNTNRHYEQTRENDEKNETEENSELRKCRAIW